MLARIVALGLILILVVGTAAGFLILRAGSPGQAAAAVLDQVLGAPVSADPRPVHVVVQSGESAATVGEKLVAAGVIRSATAFRWYVRLQGWGGRIEAGDYELRPNMSLEEVVTTLVQGRMSGGFFTVPEGWRALEIADALDRADVTSHDDFLAVVDHPTDIASAALAYLPPGRSLEGFLYPDSYRFQPSTPARVVVQRMVDDFASHLTPEIVAGFQANGLTPYEGVILASIVEREAVVADERPVIASVYLNRLRRGMRLQADPTVQYALIDPKVARMPLTGYWKRGLTFADLAVESPFNTYQVVGLPPTPICNPGSASLRAVAQPALTAYLYFVARRDGTHAFAQTLEEQEENVARYQS